MMRMSVSWDKAKYDERHDVLHVFLGKCNSFDAYAEEEYPGIFIKKCEDTEEIVGLTILDYQKRKGELSELLPEYDFAI